MTATIDYQQLATALLKETGVSQTLRAAHKDFPSSTPTTYYVHGNGGLFSYPGLDKRLFSAMVLPRLGLQSILPAYPSNEQNPLYGIITGVTATSGSEPVGVCDDPPTVGLTKLCMHSFQFGRQSRQSRVFDLDRIGLVTNRGEFTDMSLLNNPFRGAGASDNPNVPTIPGINGASANLNAEVAMQMFQLAVGWARDFAYQTYTGNPSSNTAGGGTKYFYGLDLLINTGYRDAVTGQACPAADSIVRSFGNLAVETYSQQIVAQITDIMRRLRTLSARAGLDPVRWVITMRQELFYQLTEVWPCAYMTYRCTTTSNTFNTSQPQFTNSSDLITMRDQMRGNYFEMTGQYLLIDGQRVDVILDDAIEESGGGNGSYISDIYFVPLTVLGGTPVTFWEYVNYDAPNGAMAAARQLAPDGQFYTTDGGRFLWHKKPANNFCVQVLAKTEPRLLLLTPYIAARLTDVKYTPLSHSESWDPSSPYFENGGRTDYLGYGPSFFSPTS